ncbi:RNA polymerase sigma factor, sigma-70 family [Cyclobacterium xiamenense]|uniref:RNA polymerase sigma factor, sigma-70 family n=1 Tax=Cyclobacterium xiamenense TaxID=1297121 RepID=A0A1H7A4H8_9BACT|nr:sigma-70 family RNA polymerase sigma factor [Cyclobacterium xiamenense]SEJ60609.1 RNA polymerase sigma factor, sigma-70 family [Cyclobacterium xiamenense]
MYKEASMNGVGSDSKDDVLWNQIKAGEMAGLEGLYTKYVRELFRLGMSIRGDQSLAKDCIQEVFLKIWQYRDSVKATDNAKLYLFKCLSNRIHKEISKEKKRYSYLHPELEDALQTEPEEAGTSSLAFPKHRKNLVEALDSLPSRQQEVIHLLYYENHCYEDISIIMGINVQSVYTLAWKALANLKKRLLLISLLLLAVLA